MSRFLLGSPYGSTFFQAVCLRHSHFWKEPPVEIGIVNWTSFISCSFFGSLQWIICLYLTSSLTTLLLYKPSARVSLGSILFPFQHYFFTVPILFLSKYPDPWTSCVKLSIAVASRKGFGDHFRYTFGPTLNPSVPQTAHLTIVFLLNM